MSATPSVSVLVTTYQHAGYVREALESLRQQTSCDFETIITDDASSDGTADLIEAWLDETGFPATFIRNPENRGICANRNTAIRRARGRYVCSLSGDDRYLPDRITRQLSYFDNLSDDVAAVYGDARLINEHGEEIGVSFLSHTLQNEPLPDDVFKRILCVGNYIPAPAVMVRRSAIIDVGLYDESLIYEDEDMWLRLAHRFSVLYMPDILVDYRVLSNSMSHSAKTRPAMLLSLLHICAKWMPLCPDMHDAISDRVLFVAKNLSLLGYEPDSVIWPDLRNAIANRMWHAAKNEILSGSGPKGFFWIHNIARNNPRNFRRLLTQFVVRTGNRKIFIFLHKIYFWALKLRVPKPPHI